MHFPRTTQGEAIDADLGSKMREAAKRGDIPVTHAILVRLGL